MITDVILKQHAGPIFNCRIVTQSGSCTDGDIPGIAHFAEHMAFKGTSKLSCKDFRKLSDRLGYFNAYTSFDKVVYHCTCLSENAAKATKLLLDMVLDATYPDEEIAKEKSVICEEIQTCRDSPNHWFWWQAYEKAWGKSVGHFQAGDEAAVRETTRDDLLAWKNQNLIDAPLVAIACGQGSLLVEVTALLRQAYKDRKRLSRCKIPNPQWSLEKSTINHGGEQVTVGWFSPGVSYRDELKSGFVTDVAAAVLGGGSSSRLFSRIREDLGLCYSVYAGHVSETNWGTSYVHGQLSKANVPKFIEEVNETIGKLLANGPSDEELGTAKASVALSWARGSQKCETVAGRGDMFFGLGDDVTLAMDTEKVIKSIQSVSKDQAMAELQRAYGGERKLIVMANGEE